MIVGKKIKLLIAVLLCCAFAEVQSQGRPAMGRQKWPLVEFNKTWHNWGFHFAPGITHHITRAHEKQIGSTAEKVELEPKGRISGYFEFGAYHFLFGAGRFLNYMDYSVAYKILKGKEAMTGSFGNGEGKFTDHYALLNFNVNNVWQLTNFSFLQNSIGVNADYAFTSNMEYGNPALGETLTERKPIITQLHYRIGYGFKLSSKWFMIPTIEVPILTVYEWDTFNPSTYFFNSRYLPIIFSIRFAWLRSKRNMDCPPVYAPKGQEQMQDRYNTQ